MKPKGIPVRGQPRSQFRQPLRRLQRTPDLDDVRERHVHGEVEANRLQDQTLDTEQMLAVLFYCLRNAQVSI